MFFDIIFDQFLQHVLLYSSYLIYLGVLCQGTSLWLEILSSTNKDMVMVNIIRQNVKICRKQVKNTWSSILKRSQLRACQNSTEFSNSASEDLTSAAPDPWLPCGASRDQHCTNQAAKKREKCWLMVDNPRKCVSSSSSCEDLGAKGSLWPRGRVTLLDF